MKPVYLLSLFYPSLKGAEKYVREAKATIQSLSGGDFHVVAFGTGYLAIGFGSDVPPADIREQLKRLPASEAQHLLIEVAHIVSGTMQEATMQWWIRHYHTIDPKR